ncbi:MAG: 2-oxoglutarate/2-oxoacid ferredoxin oxidoreductase subunit alpha [Acidobacteriota bacterium]|jgi:2-oxoglutarate ferredoxin oxidoreductase subunit alpha|nr:2-oxoglutarate/2-oxoacid ferredoxin oxidoreductase subunit alpha [Acidobacteriota bacterium]
MSTTVAENEHPHVEAQKLDEVVIRFAGDSGDGMQLTGSQFSTTSALMGNDLSTLPDFPAEIRAPQGTLPGVSAFQVRIADYDIHTPGDAPDVLVAMNPAALKKELEDLKPNGVIIVNLDEFNQRNLTKAGYTKNPLEDHSLDKYRVFQAQIGTMNRRALEGSGLDNKSQERCKNFFALGMVYWLFSRPLEPTIEYLKKTFAKKPELADANIKTLKAGWNFCDITGLFQVRYEVDPATLEPGVYRSIHGNSALAIGLVAAARQSGLPLFLGAYPITPASDILHQLSGYKNFGVTTFQAEDEIAAMCATIGAAFGGALAVTTTSGPGIALKSEAMNLAIQVELPVVICDIQRGGPSTGLPTKTEQSDLLQVMFGRNGDSPLVVVAPSSPKDCFDMAIEACRIALKYMVPVVLLSDGYIANGSEPWKLPEVADLPNLKPHFRTDPEGFQPYLREAETLARPWAIPGTPGLEHRIGGLEKEAVTGNVSYDPHNHETMVHLRAEKVARIADDIPELEVFGDQTGDLLVLGWGSTAGSITAAVNFARRDGLSVSRVHLRHLNPFPKNLGEVLRRFDRVLLPEMNMGQLALLIRARYLKDVITFSKVQGRPFTRTEIYNKIREILEPVSHVN